jgi:multisubunit Na+/H+ antiporter MnhB subunit
MKKNFCATIARFPIPFILLAVWYLFLAAAVTPGLAAVGKLDAAKSSGSRV